VRRAIVLTCLLVLAACSGAAATPSPLSSTEPEGTPTTVRTPDEAAARVLALDGRFAGLKAFDPGVIGACCFYRASATADGFQVTIEVGWGDCPAGCINRHRWVFSVTPLGDVSLTNESGPPVPADVLPSATGSAAPAPQRSAAPSDASGGRLPTGVGIIGTASAGPTCPVVQPSDPACEDRPVAGATIHISAVDGVEVATLTTDAAGRFWVDLEPGDYRVAADAVEGVLGTPAPLDVTVDGVEIVTLSYDTGIR